MPKQDLKKDFKEYFSAPSEKPVILELPEYQYLMVDGKGHPEGKEFGEAAGALFATSYVAKFMVKKACPENDYVVAPMEVRWYLDRTKHGPERYSWTMMIMQPPSVTGKVIWEAVADAKTRSMKKKKPLSGFDSVRFATMQEGLCAQILHKGPYHGPMEAAFAKLKKEVTARGYEHETESHDIYFNFPPRTPPEKLKTLIRVRLFPKAKNKGKAQA
jgi:hypothetical protein